ncbi:conserved hypothetical protein [Leishmania mexicana MHOM/GT/2001/U1103]|uniref:Uncharacterized protein n=1 Tax=Leishmania mexicana (strain MHOM/GT/2001/U1103) TaxID=929439 RepID=E9AZ46_LEIMU|nr:conserved hypothetical protein [Leishmania mexicana MHOM/GT/2001/U1103]CBZ28243.1 conserved hypothetical protein [Leishmania mexicana MHOM/GT/2001/U1103]
MEEWIKASLTDKYIDKVDASSVQSGVFCEAFTSPWYDGGVVFDWTALHQRLTQPTVALSDMTKAVATLRRFGAEALMAASGEGDKKCFSTVVELREPWTLHPLSEQAQRLSVFDVLSVTASSTPTAAAASNSPAISSSDSRQLYTFLRGPPGQRTVRDDMARVLSSAAEQFRGSGVRVVSFLSSFVLFGSDFTDMLHSTAAVFRALTEAGFSIDSHGSCLGPRVVTPLRVDADDWWTTSPLQQIESEEDVAALLVSLFYQWLQDAYVWGCTAPIRLFLDAKETHATQSRRLLERFVRGLVLPRARTIGLDALYASLPEEGGSLLELAAAGLEKKQAPTGLQRWSVVELRVVLAQLGAYEHIPSEYLGQPLNNTRR